MNGDKQSQKRQKEALHTFPLMGHHATALTRRGRSINCRTANEVESRTETRAPLAVAW